MSAKVSDRDSWVEGLAALHLLDALAQ